MLCKPSHRPFFWLSLFPHEGNISTADQISFTQKSTATPLESTIPMIDQGHPTSEKLGV